MLIAALGVLFQVSLATPDPLPPAAVDTSYMAQVADSVFGSNRHRALTPPRWDQSRLWDAMADTGKRRRAQAIEYSETYATRVTVHRVLSYAMIPLFIGAGYTGFQLRNKGVNAPQWTRDLHGPIAAGTAIVFGMNTLTGVWNLWEGRKDPEGRGKRLLHSAMFLAAGAGFTYVIAAGDNIYTSGKGNHWHRDVALASMSVSLVSWSIMIFR
ncbi:MAG: hypothetical protein AB7L66_01400 [Gemmatimonadales bacterium]